MNSQEFGIEFLLSKSNINLLIKDYERRIKESRQGLQLEANLSSIDFHILERAYDDISLSLQQYWFQRNESYRTLYEKLSKIVFNDASRLKILPSVWIGSYCVDLLLPRYGLGFELDGRVHNRELIMKKDHFKADMYQGLGITIAHIENQDYRKFFSSLISDIRYRKIAPLDFRKSRRIMKKVYIKTIAVHAKDLFMQIPNGKTFMDEQHPLLKQRGDLTKNKGITIC